MSLPPWLCNNIFRVRLPFLTAERAQTHQRGGRLHHFQRGLACCRGPSHLPRPGRLPAEGQVTCGGSARCAHFWPQGPWCDLYGPGLRWTLGCPEQWGGRCLRTDEAQWTSLRSSEPRHEGIWHRITRQYQRPRRWSPQCQWRERSRAYNVRKVSCIVFWARCCSNQICYVCQLEVAVISENWVDHIDPLQCLYCIHAIIFCST